PPAALFPPDTRILPSAKVAAAKSTRAVPSEPEPVHDGATAVGTAGGATVDGLEPPPVRRNAPPSTSAPITAAVATRKVSVIVGNLHGARRRCGVDGGADRAVS